jgi:hypothetical protein
MVLNSSWLSSGLSAHYIIQRCLQFPFTPFKDVYSLHFQPHYSRVHALTLFL